jgi:hypothetical protein
MKITANTRIDVTYRTTGTLAQEEQVAGQTSAQVALEPAERFAARETWGSGRQFSVEYLSYAHGSTTSASASGAVIRKDGSLGTARVSRTTIRVEDIPIDLLRMLQAANQASADKARSLIQSQEV